MMMPNPTKSAITITCSMVELTIGSNRFDGKIFTIVSMKLVGSAASYARSLVSSTLYVPLKRFAKMRPITMANAVVQK